MDELRILDELTVLLETNGVIIRSEPLGGTGGGLCQVKGEDIFFLDTQAPAAEIAPLCAEAVAKIVDIENIYIKPGVRQYIEQYGKSKKTQ